MKKYLLFFLVGSVLITSGCSKEKFTSWTNNPKAVAGAIATGLCAGVYYFRDSLGLKKKVRNVVIEDSLPEIETVEEAIEEVLS